MELFNAVQLISLFASGPFLITFVRDATFYAHSFLFYVLVAGYIAGFALLVAMLAEKMMGRR